MRMAMWLLASLLAWAAVPAPAEAVTPSEARELRRLFREGAYEVRNKRHRRALKIYEQALRIEARDVDLYYNLYTISKALRLCPRILRYGHGFLYLDPASSEARDARATLARCRKRMAGDLGAVTIRSKPEGAEVFIDGVLQGRSPLLDHPVPTGEHELRLTHPECEPEELPFRLEPELPLDLQPEMTPKVLFGFLTVTTTPAEGVEIYLDEKPVGRTPLAAPLRVQTRRYLMRLHLPEWDRWVRYVAIRPEKTTEVEAELEQTEGAPTPSAPPEPRPEPPPILRQ